MSESSAEGERLKSLDRNEISDNEQFFTSDLINIPAAMYLCPVMVTTQWQLLKYHPAAHKPNNLPT